MSNNRKSMLTTAAAISLVLGACGGSAATRSEGGDTVIATQQEFSIQLSTGSVKGGNVGIKVHDTGKTDHEFVVFRTDLA